VTGVSLKEATVFVEGVVRKDAKGKEKPIPISASAVYITDFDLSDKLRAGKLRVQRQAAEQGPAAGAKAPEEKK
jgi:ribosomal protein L24